MAESRFVGWEHRNRAGACFPRRWLRLAILAVLFLLGRGSPLALAEPWVEVGNIALRHDIQVLRDAGLLRGPVTTWPLSWGDLLWQLGGVDPDRGVTAMVEAARRRVLARARRESRLGVVRLRGRASLASRPVELRTFEGTPRENQEITGGAAWLGKRFALRLLGTAAGSPSDDRPLRLDGSYAGAAIGNWMISANTMDRWWGPGWEGSLILSNNARPVPMITVERNRSEPFQAWWLRWLGPWRVVFFTGRLEAGRAVPHALFSGLRVNVSPLRDLEIGLNRTAQWGGRGRPTGLDTIANLVLGRDNRGSQGISRQNEPGNQIAGYDFRWRSPLFDAPYAVYGQLVGEDATSLPTRNLGLFGVETWGGVGRSDSSFRLHLEYADTAAAFLDRPPNFNFAYNHGIYRSGYRYRSRSLGHALDNDSRMLSLGAQVMEPTGRSWRFLTRYAVINRDDAGLNRVARRAESRVGVEISAIVPLGTSELHLGVGLERGRVDFSGDSRLGLLAFIEWTYTP